MEIKSKFHREVRLLITVCKMDSMGRSVKRWLAELEARGREALLYDGLASEDRTQGLRSCACPGKHFLKRAP